jgi:hypothetical protein
MTHMTEEQFAQLQARGNGTMLPPAGRSMKPWQERESGVLKTCLGMLHVWGCDVVRCNTGSAWREYTSKKTGIKKRYYITFGKKGMGDILAITPAGRWLEVETKTASGELREAQERRRDAVRLKNGLYIVARSPEALELHKDEILAEAW